MLLQVAQHATDLDRAAEWYSRLLDRSPSAHFDPPGLLFFDLDGVRLLLDAKAPSSLLYLRVPSVPATLERLRASGTVVETEPHTIFSHADDTLGPAGHDEVQAFVRDSEGNLVGLVELRAAAPASN